MAELATIARPYAEAVFRVAVPAKLNAWAETLSEMSQVAAVPEFQADSETPSPVGQTLVAVADLA